MDDDVDARSERGALGLAIFILGYAIGLLPLGPLPKTYGRSIVRKLAYLLYFAFNTACEFPQTQGELITFRFLSGLGESVPLVASTDLTYSYTRDLPG